MLTTVPKLSTVSIMVSHQKTFYHLGDVELFRSSNKLLVDNLRERYETRKRVEIPEPPEAGKVTHPATRPCNSGVNPRILGISPI
jgi:hypothetical protein